MAEGLDHLINLIEKSLSLDSQEKYQKIRGRNPSSFSKV